MAEQHLDLIDRQALLAKKTEMELCFAVSEYDIANAPRVDAAPVVHGQWETDKEDIEWGNSLKRKHCTNCGKRPHFDKEKRVFVLTDFCHHCGAKMGGERRTDGSES